MGGTIVLWGEEERVAVIGLRDDNNQATTVEIVSISKARPSLKAKIS
jgi:hypothetical protein